MPERWIIVLEPLPDRPGAIRRPMEQRVRQLLKIALRGFGLRAMDVREQAAAERVRSEEGSHDDG